MRQQNDRNSKHETKSCFQVLILGATHPYLCHNWNSKHNVLGVNSWGANPVPCLHPQGGGYPLQKGDTFLLPTAKVQLEHMSGPEGWGQDDLQGLQAEQQEHAQLQVLQ